jgi:hypothetical protein
MIRMNDARHGANKQSHQYLLHLLDVILVSAETRKHRMTYERAGLLFRAMNYKPDACAQVAVQDIVDMGLTLPDNPGRFPFAQFLDENTDRLQLFDEEPIVQFESLIYDDGEFESKHYCLYEGEYTL